MIYYKFETIREATDTLLKLSARIGSTDPTTAEREVAGYDLDGRFTGTADSLIALIGGWYEQAMLRYGRLCALVGETLEEGEAIVHRCRLLVGKDENRVGLFVQQHFETSSGCLDQNPVAEFYVYRGDSYHCYFTDGKQWEDFGEEWESLDDWEVVE